MKALLVFAENGCTTVGPFPDHDSARGYASENIGDNDNETTWAIVPLVMVVNDSGGEGGQPDQSQTQAVSQIA